MTKTINQEINKQLDAYVKENKGIKIKDETFIKRLFELNIPPIYLHLFEDSDAKLDNRQLWRIVNKSGIEPLQDKSLLYKAGGTSLVNEKNKFKVKAKTDEAAATLETVKIYSVIPLQENGYKREIIINSSERKTYLDCKFWKETEEEAEIFALYYIPTSPCDLCRAIALLSGEYLKKDQSLDEAYSKILKAKVIYFDYKDKFKKLDKNAVVEIKLAPDLKETDGTIPINHLYKIYDIHHLKTIINEIFRGANNKEFDFSMGIIDELLIWAKNNKIFNPNIIKEAQRQVEATRTSVFKGNSSLNAENIHIVKPFILNLWWLSYQDAKALLFPDFPDKELINELMLSVERGELSACFLKGDISSYYFKPKALIKWLMKHDYLAEWLIAEFIDLKKESIKESQIEYLPRMLSLEQALKINSRENILQDAIAGKCRLYFKYPRDNIKWDEPSSATTCKNLPIKRYKGLGQIKAERKEDTHNCSHGGVTVDMLFYREKPAHILSEYGISPHRIEFVPTEEEAKYGLQPYIKVAQNEIAELIADSNLMYLPQIHLTKKLEEFELELIDHLRETVKLNEWPPEHFAALLAGLSFRNKLEAKKDIIKSHPSQPTLKILVTKKFFDDYDIQLAANEVVEYYSKLLEKLRINCNKNLSPVEMLEFATKKSIKIPYEVANIIRFNHYGLNENEAKNGKPRGEIFNISEAAKFLANQLNEDVSEQRVLDWCVKTDTFGAYINSERYCIKLNKGLSHNQVISRLEYYRDNNLTELTYEYSYDGLIRLIKVSNVIKKSDLIHIRNEGTIKIDHQNIFIPLQPSLSNLVSGINLGIKYSDKNAEITRENLFFRKEELLKFAENKIKAQPQSNTNKDQAEKRQEAKQVLADLGVRNDTSDNQESVKKNTDRGIHHSENRAEFLKGALKFIVENKIGDITAKNLMPKLEKYFKTSYKTKSLPLSYGKAGRELGRWKKPLDQYSPISNRSFESQNEKLFGACLSIIHNSSTKCESLEELCEYLRGQVCLMAKKIELSLCADEIANKISFVVKS